MSIKLSFVVPVYNVERWLDNCLGSLYRQKLDENEFEVVCINDGSTDGSLDILQRWGGEKNNIVIISQENKGMSAARNTGIQYAKGQYIRFIDSDDYIADDVTSGPLQAAIANKIDILYTQTKRTSDENAYVSESHNEGKINFILQGKSYFEKYNVPNGVWEYFISKALIVDNDLSFVEGRMCEDGMFTLSALMCASSVSKYDIDYYRYVVRENSITTSRSLEHLKKTVDDFSYAISYINRLINQEIEEFGCNAFSNKLIQRRNSYFFYFQIRCIRARLKTSELKKYLTELREIGCYPNAGLTKDYGLSHVILSKLFQYELVFLLICRMYRLAC